MSEEGKVITVETSRLSVLVSSPWRRAAAFTRCSPHCPSERYRPEQGGGGGGWRGETEGRLEGTDQTGAGDRGLRVDAHPTPINEETSIRAAAIRRQSEQWQSEQWQSEQCQSDVNQSSVNQSSVNQSSANQTSIRAVSIRAVAIRAVPIRAVSIRRQ